MVKIKVQFVNVVILQLTILDVSFTLKSLTGSAADAVEQRCRACV